MCYLCSCFVYAIDFIQRIITCCLLYILTYVVCFGFAIAIIAGIAYGYNYSLAEFLAFSRSDVSVFMRRGQFYDKPELPVAKRRSDGGEESIFANRSSDYEESDSQSQPLADTWLQSQDTRKYAEKLTKYIPEKPVENYIGRIQEPIRPKPQAIPKSPLLATVSWQSGTSDIIMRSYRPQHDLGPADVPNVQDDEVATPNTSIKSLGFLGAQNKLKNSVDSREQSESDFVSSAIQMRMWTPALRRIVTEYVTEEVDEDNILYKPV